MPVTHANCGRFVEEEERNMGTIPGIWPSMFILLGFAYLLLPNRIIRR